MEYRTPQLGSIRVRSGFLLMPRTINGVTKWLERAEWEQTYTTVVDFSPEGPMPKDAWLDTDWRPNA